MQSKSDEEKQKYEYTFKHFLCKDNNGHIRKYLNWPAISADTYLSFTEHKKHRFTPDVFQKK